MPFYRIAPARSVPEGVPVGIDIEGHSILLCRSGGALFAVRNRCTHAQSRLDGGRVCAGIITCPLHGARFDLASGKCKSKALGYDPLETYEVREVGGFIEVELP